MKRSGITYGQLNRAMTALGVSHRRCGDEPPTNVYEHPDRGPIFMLPAFPERNRVFLHHLAEARILLEQFGIAEPAEFDANIQKAG